MMLRTQPRLDMLSTIFQPLLILMIRHSWGKVINRYNLCTLKDILSVSGFLRICFFKNIYNDIWRINLKKN